MPPDAQQINALVGRLSQIQLDSDACNQYAPGDEDNAIRRANLVLYLQTVLARQPKALLLMEAPGYRGCRLTGVPVTSRKVLLEGVPGLNLFGESAGFRDVSDRGFERVQGEQSATIVWGTLAEMKSLPLIWNAFPFHPHQPDKPLSNRRPRKSELELGASILLRLLELWRFKLVVAVGNVARDTLTAKGIDCANLRHPAHGGKADFVAGIRQLLSFSA